MTKFKFKKILPAISVILAMTFILMACAGKQGNPGNQGEPGSPGNPGQDLTSPPVGQISLLADTWFENAFAIWRAQPNQQYFCVDIRLGDGQWQAVDSQLIRQTNVSLNQWRVDVPGLRNNLTTQDGLYQMRVGQWENGNWKYTETQRLKPTPFDRQGYAFSLNTVNGLSTTNGGYNDDGTVKADAEIIYVNHQNMNLTLNPERFSTKFDQSVNTVHQDGTTQARPLIVRIMGQVGKVNSVGDIQDIPLAAALNLGSSEGDNAIPQRPTNMLPFNGAKNVTIEGIGSDAKLVGWGLALTRTQNIEVRNLTIQDHFQDAIEISGSGDGLTNDLYVYSHTWVHNNVILPGQNRYQEGLGDVDHLKGDGGCDIVRGATHFTVSYNHFVKLGKSMLIGGGANARMGHGTIHHNYFDRTEERTPRLRNGWVHIFNNIYEGTGGLPSDSVEGSGNPTGGGYGIGAGHRANIVAEGNDFSRAYRPIIISGEKSALSAGPNPDGVFNTLSNDAPGIVLTSMYNPKDGLPSIQDLTGRILQPNQFDDSSINGNGWGTDYHGVDKWWYPQELELSNGPTIINDNRGGSSNPTQNAVKFHTFVRFDATLEQGGVPLGSAFNSDSGGDFNAQFLAKDEVKEAIVSSKDDYKNADWSKVTFDKNDFRVAQNFEEPSTPNESSTGDDKFIYDNYIKDSIVGVQNGGRWTHRESLQNTLSTAIGVQEVKQANQRVRLYCGTMH